MSKITFSERYASLLADCSASVVIFSEAKERLSRTQSQACLSYAEAMVFLGEAKVRFAPPPREGDSEQVGLDFVFLLRTSAIQVNLIALGLASVQAILPCV